MFYLLSYNLTTTSQAGLLLGQNSKLTSLIYNDFPLIINYLPVLKFIFIFQVLAAAGFPIFNVVVIKFYLNCIGGMNNSYLVLPLIITQTSLAAAQSYLRIIKLMSKLITSSLKNGVSFHYFMILGSIFNLFIFIQVSMIIQFEGCSPITSMQPKRIIGLRFIFFKLILVKGYSQTVSLLLIK